MPPRGHRKANIDWKMVANMLAIQCTGEEIAGIYDISFDSLETYCKKDNKMDWNQYAAMHTSKGHVSLRRRIWKKAIEEGNTPTLIFLAKAYLGLRDGFTYIQPNGAKTENGEAKQVVVYETQFTNVSSEGES